MSDIPINDDIIVEGDERFLPSNDEEGDISDAYMTTDSESTDIADDDYIPFYDTSTSTKKKSLWSNLVNKLKSVFNPPITDIVNIYGAKNLLPYPYNQTTKTSDGVTFTDNGDGSVTLNGTNTGANTIFMFRYRPEDKTIRLFTELKKMNTSFKLLGGNDIPRVVYNIDFYDSSSTYISSVMNRNDTPTVFTIPSNAESANIFIRCVKDAVYSNLTIYPMLYLASIEDNTYEPYAKTNQELTADTEALTNQANDMVNVLGAKNLIPNNATSQTINGVTFTVNSDGTVTVSGTATGDATLYLTDSIDLSLFNGMLLNGCPVPSSADAILRLVMNKSPWTGISQNVSDAEIDGFASGTLGRLFIRVYSGRTVNATFKPMIRLASIQDDTYVPYAKTNQQLTEDTLVAYKTADSASTTINDTDYIPISESNGTTRKKALWTTIIAKIKSSLATVATSGSYNDLSDKPTIPSVVNNLTSDSTTDALSAAQGKALANGSARDSTKLPLAGGLVTGIVSGKNHFQTTARCQGATGLIAGAHALQIDGTTYAQDGYVRVYGINGTYRTDIKANGSLAADIETTLPASSGTLALTSQLTNGSVTKVGTATVGANANTPMRLNAGVPTACNSFVPTSGGTFNGRVDINRGTDGLDLVIGDTNDRGKVALMGAGSNYGTFTEDLVKLNGNRTYSIPNSTGIIQVSSSSSRRVKKNIRDMTEEEAKKLLDVNIVKFDYKGNWCGGEKNQSGVIAEDTIDIMPEVVHIPKSYDPNAPVDEEYNLPPDVDYRKFIPYLIKMVQVQEQRINELESMIKS